MERPDATDSTRHEPTAEVAPEALLGVVPGIAHAEGPPPADRARPFWAWAVVLFLGVIWGLTFSLAKIATAGGAHPLGITLWQALFGAVILGTVALLRRRPLSAKPWALQLYALCGLLGTVVPGILFFYAASRVPAGVLSITVTIVPILTFALSALFGLDRFGFLRIMGVLFGALAVALLVAPERSLPDPGAAPWVLAACVASACYAVENLVIALRMPDGVDPFTVAFGMFLAATAMLAPVVIATGSFVALAWPWGPVEWSIAGMAAVSALAYSLYIYLIGWTGPVFASQVAYAVTLAGVLWGMALFGERHSPWIWLSLALMLAGLALVAPRKRKRVSMPD
ncbi:MAG: DMT family transporter [Alphaproteobacteria bacterium]